MLRILIADDHPIVRQGLGQLIAKTADMIVADEASNGSEVLDKARASHFDVVLLDISMPGLHGLDINFDAWFAWFGYHKTTEEGKPQTSYSDTEYAFRRTVRCASFQSRCVGVFDKAKRAG
jgi:hypothetical protein